MDTNILREAEEIIFGDREKTYGNPAFNLESIAEFWMLYIARTHNVQVPLTPTDICYLMVLLKLARLMNSPEHEDSQRDGIGYFALASRIQRAERELPPTIGEAANDMQ
jgi:hypothetical protein